jgi:hypothetical protein
VEVIVDEAGDGAVGVRAPERRSLGADLGLGERRATAVGEELEAAPLPGGAVVDEDEPAAWRLGGKRPAVPGRGN